MNKFFRLVSMFAIAGATFAYTSCTDYSEDINKANDRIDKVEGDVDGIDGRLKTVEGQVSSLNTAVDGLKDAQTKAEASITELQTALKALQDKHAEDIAKLEKDYAAADAALKSEIQGQIDALTKTHAADVERLTASINALKTDVEALQKKAAEVEAVLPTLAKQAELDDIKNNIIPTLATKDSLEAVSNRLAKLSKSVADQIAGINTTIGTLQGDLEVAQTNITALQEKMTKAEEDIASMKGDIANLQAAVKNAQAAAEKAQKAAEAAQTAADNAQKDATAALGNIESLKNALGEYAEVGALEAKIAALEKMDSTFKADKFDTKDFDTTFTKALKDVLGGYAEKTVLASTIAALQSKDIDLQNQITKLGLDIEDVENNLKSQISQVSKDLEEVEDSLNVKISKLDTKVEDYNTAVNGRIDSVLGIIAGRLSSIAFVPKYYYDGVPAILFETIAYNPLEDAKEDVEAMAPIVGKQNSIDANKFSDFTTAIAKAQYRLNPRTVGADCADFSFVGDKADYVSTRATAPDAPVSIDGTPVYDAKTGYVTFSVKKNEPLNVTDNSNKNLDIVALKAVLKKGLTEAEAAAENKPEVYSEYTHVNEIAYSAGNLAISDSLNLATKSIKRAESINGHEYAKTFTAATKQDPVYDMPYDDEFNLRKLIATCINTKIFTAGLEETQDHIELDLTKYDLKYRFSVAQTPYNVDSKETTTDQQAVIECIDAENGIYKVISTDNAKFNKEAIGRTPIVRVDLMHNGNIVTRAFIKLRITVNKKNYPVNVSYKNLNVVYECPETKVTMSYNEDDLRKELYRVLDIDHVSFWNIYEPYKAYVTKGGMASTITAPELLEGVDENGKATKKVVWNFTHGEVGKIGEKGALVEGYLVVKNKIDASSEYPTEITFKFTVNFRILTREELGITAEINDIFWKGGILQANVNRPESITDVAENCWFCTPIADQPWKELSVKNLPCGESPYFRIASVCKDGTTSDYQGIEDGVYLTDKDGTTELSIALDKTNASIKAALNSEKGLQAIIEWYAVGKSGNAEEGYDEYVLQTFTVDFRRPVDLNLPATLSVRDAVDGGDEITFGYEGLLTDWRGNVILPPTEMEVLNEGYYWRKACSPADHAVLVPAYTKVIKEGYYEVEFQDVDVVIPAGAPFYKASIQLSVESKLKTWYDNGKWGKRPKDENWKNTEVVYGYGRSEGEAKEAARAKVNLLDPHYLDGETECGRMASEPKVEVITNGSTEFSFKVISKVTYHQPVTKKVEAKLIYSECNEKPGPSDDVYTVGQRIGCWEWQKYVYADVDENPGQYWDFYGEFSDIVLDLERYPDGSYKNVTTDLPDADGNLPGKLPSGASLVQTTGYKLRYENVQSPIQYSYHIYIPMSIQYGWGTLNGTLTITVNPVSTIK